VTSDVVLPVIPAPSFHDTRGLRKIKPGLNILRISIFEWWRVTHSVLFDTRRCACGEHSQKCLVLNPGSLPEEYFMLGINRILSGALLAVAIAAPVVVTATPTPQELQVRVYDSNHRDYHNWDDHEDRAYRRYYSEQHRQYRAYDRENARRQRAYWKWRHNHPDRD
jgi:hypothetical protein